MKLLFILALTLLGPLTHALQSADGQPVVYSRGDLNETPFELTLNTDGSGRYIDSLGDVRVQWVAGPNSLALTFDLNDTIKLEAYQSRGPNGTLILTVSKLERLVINEHSGSTLIHRTHELTYPDGEKPTDHVVTVSDGFQSAPLANAGFTEFNIPGETLLTLPMAKGGEETISFDALMMFRADGTGAYLVGNLALPQNSFIWTLSADKKELQVRFAGGLDLIYWRRLNGENLPLAIGKHRQATFTRILDGMIVESSRQEATGVLPGTLPGKFESTVDGKVTGGTYDWLADGTGTISFADGTVVAFTWTADAQNLILMRWSHNEYDENGDLTRRRQINTLEGVRECQATPGSCELWNQRNYLLLKDTAGTLSLLRDMFIFFPGQEPERSPTMVQYFKRLN